MNEPRAWRAGIIATTQMPSNTELLRNYYNLFQLLFHSITIIMHFLHPTSCSFVVPHQRKRTSKVKTLTCLNYPTLLARWCQLRLAFCQPFDLWGILSDKENRDVETKPWSSGLTCSESVLAKRSVSRRGWASVEKHQTPTRHLVSLTDMRAAEGAVMEKKPKKPRNDKNGVSEKVEGCGSIVTGPLGNGHRWCIIWLRLWIMQCDASLTHCLCALTTIAAAWCWDAATFTQAYVFSRGGATAVRLHRTVLQLIGTTKAIANFPEKGHPFIASSNP